MPAPSKTHLLNDVYDLLRKHYKIDPKPDRSTVLEAVVLGICHEGVTLEQALSGYTRLTSGFHDWNELRVSSMTEIEAALAGLPDAADRARKVRRFLRQLFERTYGFSLEPLLKKPQKEAVKALQEYEALQSDFVLATVIQRALGGHAIPVDRDIHRALSRLHLAAPDQDTESIRSTLERAIPKTRGAHFQEVLHCLAHDVCIEPEPVCHRCSLRKVCPTGQARLNTSKSKTSSKAATASSTQADSTRDAGPATSLESSSSQAKPAAGSRSPSRKTAKAGRDDGQVKAASASDKGSDTALAPHPEAKPKAKSKSKASATATTESRSSTPSPTPRGRQAGSPPAEPKSRPAPTAAKRPAVSAKPSAKPVKAVPSGGKRPGSPKSAAARKAH